MRIRWLIGGLALGCMVVGGCKTKSSASNDGGDYTDSGPYEAPPPIPGTCRALCCSNNDCYAGETCTPFNSAWGTLGYCSGITPDGGDAGLSLDAGADFAAACWTFSTPQCNPLSNSQCDAGDACDIDGMSIDAGGVPAVECQSGVNEVGPGGSCEIENGPFCIPGYHCVPNP